MDVSREVEAEINRRIKQELVDIEVAKRLARISSLGDDEWLDGQVVRFQYKFTDSDDLYSYAAIKTKDRWYVTGHPSRSMTWKELTAWIASSDAPSVEIHIMAYFDKVPL